jgi:nitrate reductase alpha subunit
MRGRRRRAGLQACIRATGGFEDLYRAKWSWDRVARGTHGANWRASGKQWCSAGLEQLEMIVAMVPDVGVTAHYADYVLPIAHHYERADLMLQARTPYVQVLDAAVPPLGEAVDDWEANR